MNINVDKIKDGLKTVGVVVVPILGAVLFNERTVRNALNEMCYVGKIGYDDAFAAIMDSAMFASDKRTAVSILKKGMDNDYYKAVVKTINSTMFASDKIQTIELINEKY